jgi:gamma-glutamyltranspeptidase/glutathione hydrolase
VARAARQRLKRHIARVIRILFVALALAWAVAALASAAPVAEASHGMVVTSHHLASEVGAGILAQGGNAIDAAVAVGYALAVVDPCCGNIGGGGFMTIRFADGRRRFLNFRETAPSAANASMYEAEARDEASRYGYRAVAVPGTVMGLERAAREYGRLARRNLLEPAIALARDGFILTRDDAALIDSKAERIAKDPVAAAVFLRRDGAPLQAGDRLRQPDLAATLRRIAENGVAGFYQGAIPQAVEAASTSGGGVITAADFARYTVTEGPPLSCSYRGYILYSAPPPSSGGTTICEMLNIVEGWDIRTLGFGSVGSVERLVKVMRRAYRDRNASLGDPAFVENPLERLLSKDYAAGARAAIEAREAAPAEPGDSPTERAQTTHYSVVDAEGNAVAVTYTINGFFGAAVMAPGTGFFLNNEMDDFTTKPGRPNLYGLMQGAANAIAPGKRPLSSMAPTIVEKDGKVVLTLGSPGGSRIITTVFETLIDIIDYGMTPQAAVAAPRFHHQGFPNVVYYERGGLSPEAVSGLQARGYKLVEQRPWGAVELIAEDNGRLVGVSDPRRPSGAAVGY